MKLRNILLAIWDQGPLTRFLRNLFKGRFTGLIHINSHQRQDTGKPKVAYNTKETAKKSAEAMSKKRGVYFSNYKCLWCDGYHIGKNTPINDFDGVFKNETNIETSSQTNPETGSGQEASGS